MFKILKVSKNAASLSRVKVADLIRFKHSKDDRPTRGLLPWEVVPKKCPKVPEEPVEKLEKTYPDGEEKEGYCGKPACEKVCPTMEKPKRNSYHIRQLERPKKYGMRSLMDKTICELRRFEKCMKEFCDKAQCSKMAPDCTKTKKTYPSRDMTHKKAVAGCEKPLPKTKKQ